MLDGSYSVSDVQDYIKHIIKKHKTFTNPQLHIYINRIGFKIKDGYKLELQTLETVKLFGRTKELIDKTKNGGNVPSLEVVGIVLIQCSLVDNQYRQKSESLYTFTTNKSFAYLLNVKPSNLLFLKTFNTESDHITIKFIDQNSRLLEIEFKVNLALLIN